MVQEVRVPLGILAPCGQRFDRAQSPAEELINWVLDTNPAHHTTPAAPAKKAGMVKAKEESEDDDEGVNWKPGGTPLQLIEGGDPGPQNRPMDTEEGL